MTGFSDYDLWKTTPPDWDAPDPDHEPEDGETICPTCDGAGVLDQDGPTCFACDGHGTKQHSARDEDEILFPGAINDEVPF